MQMKDKRHPLCAKGYLILYMGGRIHHINLRPGAHNVPLAIDYL